MRRGKHLCITAVIAAISLFVLTPAARATILVWYEYVDGTGPDGEPTVAQQGEAKKPLIIETTETTGTRTLTMRCIANVSKSEALLGYSVEIGHLKTPIAEATDFFYLADLGFTTRAALGTDPLISSASQSSFTPLYGEVELFEFTIEYDMPASIPIAIRTAIGNSSWHTTAGTASVVFADAAPLQIHKDGYSSTPSIIIRKHEEVDCDENGVPDDEEIAADPSLDCNENGVLDFCDIRDETSPDLNENGIPDECEPDCDENGVPDDLDIYDGTHADCNENGIPDVCDIAEGREEDCDENGIPDACDLEIGTYEDCNGNGIPDLCDIDDGTSLDCNDNGIPDKCDLSDGTSFDTNANSIPDECESGSGANTGGNTSGSTGDTPGVDRPSGNAYSDGDNTNDDSQTTGHMINRDHLRAFLALVFNVPTETQTTLSSLPVGLYGLYGTPMTALMFGAELINMPLRIFMFEATYGFLDAILP